MTLAQTNFKEGYIVNNRNERINCLIRNVSSDESMINYEYKLKEDAKIEKIELSKIEEFGIENELKCIRALIAIDLSRTHILDKRDAVMKWEEGHAFLKVLFEGELATLYSYFHEGESLFFFSREDGVIEPLVHKNYNIGSTTPLNQQILSNNTYREQLKQTLSCDNSKEVEKVSYTEKDLIKFFTNYHNCKKTDYQQFKITPVKNGKLLIKPGININRNQFTIKNLNSASLKAAFVKENSVGFGLEVEYIIPFNNYAWGFFTEANYLSYETDQKVVADLYEEYKIDYKSIEIPVGINYNININKNQKIYIKAAIVPHFIFGSSYILFNEGGTKNKFAPSSKFLFGLGYSFHNVGLELRYYTSENITENLYKRGSELTQISAKVLYSFQLFGE